MGGCVVEWRRRCWRDRERKKNSFEVLVGLNEVVETGRRKFVQPYTTYVGFDIEFLEIERENCALFQQRRVAFKREYSYNGVLVPCVCILLRAVCSIFCSFEQFQIKIRNFLNTKISRFFYGN